ncbi:MAG: hypothetical protein JO051_17335 [Acidobacteriaceae bacterium]|nr:hypothetical protein [Acidobacteriaceae bacterium]
MIRYLLGDVSEEEQLQLEEEFFANDERYQELLALEDELRYDYAQGGLSGHQRELFNRRFLGDRTGREKIALAQNVLEKAFAASSEVAQPERRAWWVAFADFFGVPWKVSFALASSAAAAAVLAVVFISQAVNLRQELNQVQARLGREQNAVNELRGRDAALSRDLEQERNRRKQLEHQAANRKPQPFVLAFALAPGLTRDGEGSKRLRVPADAASVRLQLDMRSGEGSRSYRAMLQNLDGQTLWSQDVRPGGSVVVLMVPARVLKPGDYLVELKSAEDTAPADYYFSIAR